MTDMRALTLHQPWAAAIAAGVKTIETRSWSTKYRGALAIHSAMRRPSGDLFAPEILPAGAPAEHYGSILCVALLVDVVTVDELLKRCAIIARELKWGCYETGRYAWGLYGVRRLIHPIPCRGRQGLWKVPDDIRKEIGTQMVAQVARSEDFWGGHVFGGNQR